MPTFSRILHNILNPPIKHKDKPSNLTNQFGSNQKYICITRNAINISCESRLYAYAVLYVCQVLMFLYGFPNAVINLELYLSALASLSFSML